MTESADSNPISPLRVTLIYTLFAGAWIISSDQLLGWLVDMPTQVSQVNMLKGGVFVIASALLIYFLLRRRSVTQLTKPTSQSNLVLPLTLLSAVILGITASLALGTLKEKEDAEFARLQTISKLKSELVTIWLNERMADARLLQSSDSLPEAYLRWRQQRDSAHREAVVQRLSDYREHGFFDGVSLLDEHGVPLWSAKAGPDQGDYHIGPEEIAKFLSAASTDKPTRLDPYQDKGGLIHLDFILRLALPNGQPGPIVVLHSDTEAYFPSAMGVWPQPNTSGDIFLFKRDQDHVMVLSPLRHRADAALNLRLPLANSRELAAQVINDPDKVGKVIKGVDYRNQDVAGIARAIPDTEWFLMTKLDQREMLADATLEATWIALSGLLLLLATGTSLMTLHQRQQLTSAQEVQQAQNERLRALHLLATIADSSTDAIFAKDLDNRFILFNRASEKLVGKPQSEVLGQDERILFPPEIAQRQLADDRKVLDSNVSLNIQEDVPTPSGLRSFITTKGPLHDEQGNVIGLYGIVHDVTESKQVESRLRQQTKELRQRNDELERFNRAMTGRELAMIDLKREVNALAREIGRAPPYNLAFAESEKTQ